MKILLTGYKGFIGSNMYNAIKDMHEVVGYDWGDPYVDIKEFDWVIHMGAISSTTETDVEKIMHQNFDFSVALYNECCENNVNFQFSSSASVYGIKKEFTENSPVDPRTPYAWSKYMFERYVNLHRPQNSLVQIFRYFNVYGPNEDHKGSQASPFHQFHKQFEEKGQVTLFENSDKYQRDFIHVDDVIDLQYRFLSVPESGVFNVGLGKTLSFYDVACLFTNDIKTVSMPEHLKHSYQEYTCADMTHTLNTLFKYFPPDKI